MMWIIIASLLIIASSGSEPMCQQPLTSRDNTGQVQWNSHQMNQPAPPQYKLSQERIEDIRRLYDQAVEETRTRKPQEASQDIEKQ